MGEVNLKVNAGISSENLKTWSDLVTLMREAEKARQGIFGNGSGTSDKSLSDLTRQLKEQTDQIAKLSAVLTEMANNGEKAFQRTSRSAGKAIDPVRQLVLVIGEIKRLSENVQSIGIFSPQEATDLSNRIAGAKNELEQISIMIDVLQNKQLEFAVDSQEFEDLGKIIGTAQTTLAFLNGTSDEFITKAQTTAARLNEVKGLLQDMRDAGLENTEMYKQLIEEAARLQQTLNTVDRELQQLSRGTFHISKLIGAFTEVASVLTIAQSAAALFGSENENVEKALLKITSLIGILNGLQQINIALTQKDSLIRGAWVAVTKAFAWAQGAANAQLIALRSALLATGIGVFIIALGTLIAYLSSVGDEADKTKKKLEELDKLFNDYDKGRQKFENAIDERSKLEVARAKLAGATEDEIFNIEQKARRSKALFLAEEIRQNQERLNNSKLTSEERIAIEEQILKQQDELNKKNIEGQTEALNNEIKIRDKAKQQSDKRKQDREKELKDVEQYLQKLKKFYQEAEISALGSIANESEREIKKLEISQRRELELLNDLYKELSGSKQLSNDERIKLDEQYEKALAGTLDRQRRESVDLAKKQAEELAQIQLNGYRVRLEIDGKSEELELIAVQEKYRKLREEAQKHNQDIAWMDEAQLREETTIRANNFVKRLEEERTYALDSLKLLTENGQKSIEQEQQIQEAKRQINEQSRKELLEGLAETYRLEGVLNEQRVEDYKEYLRNFDPSTGKRLSFTQFLGIDGSVTPEDEKIINTAVNNTSNEAEKAVKKRRGNLGIISLLGLDSDLTDQERQVVERGLQLTQQMALESFKGIMDARAQAVNDEIALIDKRLDKMREAISEQESIADREKQLAEDGYANNYAIEQQKLNDLKAQEAEQLAVRQEATNKLIQIQKQQAIADYALSTASMIAASAGVIKDAVGQMGWIGAIVGVATAGAMVAGFFALQSQLKSLDNQAQMFRDGGALELLNGQPSHEQGGVGLYNEVSGRKIAEFEGNESLFVVNKGSTAKFKPLLALINDNDEAGMMNYFLNRAVLNEPLIDATLAKANEIKIVEYRAKAQELNFHNEDLKDIARTNRRMYEMELYRKSEKEKKRDFAGKIKL